METRWAVKTRQRALKQTKYSFMKSNQHIQTTVCALQVFIFWKNSLSSSLNSQPTTKRNRSYKVDEISDEEKSKRKVPEEKSGAIQKTDALK